MDLKLIERFLSHMVPKTPEAQQSVNWAFEIMRAHPMTAVPGISIMLGKFQHQLYSIDENEQAKAGALLLTGVMLAWASEDKFLRETILDHYINESEKRLGKNVVSFFDKKAGR